MKDRIYQLMKQLGLSQQDFAKETGIAISSLSGIFNGRTKPTGNTISAIHHRFPEVSISWLMFDEGPMYVGETVVEPSPEETKSLPNAQSTPTLDSPDLFSSLPNNSQPAAIPTPVQPIVRETIKYLDKPQRKITEIRVFFDDGTFETFSSL